MTTASLSAVWKKCVRDSYYFVGLIACMSLLSSLLFIFQFFPPQFDDAGNMVDVAMYQKRGFSGIIDQVNAPGPAGFMWASLGASITHDALVGARLSMWLGWLLLVTGYMLTDAKQAGKYPVVGFLL